MATCRAPCARVSWRDLSRRGSWGSRELSGLIEAGTPGAGRPYLDLGVAEFALGQNSNNLKESAVDLQPLTTIQQNNFTPNRPIPVTQ